MSTITMDNIQQTDEQPQNSPVDPQVADIGTTGEQTLGLAPEADPAQRTDKGSAADPLTDADAAADLAGEPRPVHPTSNYGAFVIAPTIGRKVHFYPNGANFHSTPLCIDQSKPMDADVVYVWNDRMVNLCVRDHIGQVHAFTSVALRQPDDATPQGAYAEWMPFQAQQARASAGA